MSRLWLAALLAGLLTPSVGSAETVVLGAAGGLDFPTRQPWAGLDLAIHPDSPDVWSGMGRVQAGWAFADGKPFANVEGGFTRNFTGQEATFRIGLAVRSWIYIANYRLPLQVSEPDPAGFGTLGFIPGGWLVGEIEWDREAEKGPAAWSVGLKAGASSVAAVRDCVDNGEAALCTAWNAGVVGGFTFRLRMHEGLALEALVGPSPSLSVGYAF